jgi:hypothetical protein
MLTSEEARTLFLLFSANIGGQKEEKIKRELTEEVAVMGGEGGRFYKYMPATQREKKTKRNVTEEGTVMGGGRG